MVESCTFCRIAKNEAPAGRIYEDQQVVAFLDNRPISEGHTLVVPKRHYTNIYEIPDEEAAYLFKIVKKVADAVQRGMKADGISIIQNNGAAAHQVIFHLHAHVIPRYEGHQSQRFREIHQENELSEVAQKIRRFI
jgi:histidine triad (HIT) family protein